MLQALEESSTLPAKDDLTQLFSLLKPAALAGLLDAIDRTQNTELRPMLEASAERLAQSNTGELVKLVMDPKPAVAREAIRRAGAMRAAAAVPALAEVLASGTDHPLRAAAAQALNEIGTGGAMSALEPALADPERDIRLATIRALTTRLHRPALARVQAMIEGKESRTADRTERLALFELFGVIAGDAGVPVLDAILNAKGGLFGKREDPEFRACAAVGLGRINTDASRLSLQRSSSEKDVLVRNAVSRALRGGGAP
jgi:HEAT repeat protein